MSNRFLALPALAAFVFVLSPSAHATLLCLPNLPPNGVAFPSVDDTCAADNNGANGPIGTQVDNTGVQSFSFTSTTGVTTRGTLQEVVYQELGGTLDFYIQVGVGSTTGGVNFVSTSNFAGFLTAVGTVSPIHLLGSGSQQPDFDNRSALGDTILWAFISHPITNGLNSFTMAISTNAVSAQAGQISLSGANGGGTSVSGFEPLAAVPEPVSIILLGTVLALAGLFIRRRHAAKA